MHFRVMQWKRIDIRHLILNFQFFIEFPAIFYCLFSSSYDNQCPLKSQEIIEMNHTTPTYHFVSFCIIRRTIEIFMINRKCVINRMQKICQCVRHFLETTKICAVYLLNILDFFSRLCRWKPLSAVSTRLRLVLNISFRK